MKKIYFVLLFAALSLTAMAQQKYELGKPNDDNYRYLDNLKPLKSYIDREKYPNFKLGAGTTVNSYNQKTTVYKMTNENFDETVAGNAMKMASCVDGNGNMNFSTVTKYVDNATAAGLKVYGHTLAWHSQQPKGWLLKLMADVPAEDLTDGDVTVWSQVANKDFRTQQSIGGWKASESEYGYSLSFDATNGLKVTTTKSYAWEVQFLIVSDIILKANKKHKMIMTIKGSKAGKLDGRVGDWGGGANVTVPFTTEWQDVEVTLTPTMASNFFLVHVPNYVGDVYVKNIWFEEEKFGQTVTEARRCLHVHASAKQNDITDNQLWINVGTYANGASYEMTFDVLADKAATAATMTYRPRGNYYHPDALGDVAFSPSWNTITLSGSFPAGGQSVIFNLSKFAEANDYYFDNISLKINGEEKIVNGDFEGSDLSMFQIRENGGELVTPTVCEEVTYVYVPTARPQTMEEKHDALVGAMDKWISGMMKACNGKVKAWDLVNEAISGGGNDGQGNYELQHSEGYQSGTWDVGGDAFYWQDYMGDLEYVRQACRLARKYGPEDIKLFINDYNLESTWDNNKKVKSLIGWINKWESDGVTKIDGIGTQMHISYYLNANDQANQQRCITNMFQLMANTGKLVRVSELDMGLCDRQFGTAKKTSELTEEEHKLMADYYEWIIKEYLRIIPPAQQWGICQWCTTDAPANSGWRGGEPVGIWDLNYYRKHAYAGFVRGLSGLPTAVEQVEKDKVLNGAVYDMQGRRVAESADMKSLPAGLYIVGGKKVAVK